MKVFAYLKLQKPSFSLLTLIWTLFPLDRFDSSHHSIHGIHRFDVDSMTFVDFAVFDSIELALIIISALISLIKVLRKILIKNQLNF